MASLPIEAKQTEPLKRNLDLPHKPPAKNSKSGYSFDFQQVSTRMQFYCLPIIIIIITETQMAKF